MKKLILSNLIFVLFFFFILPGSSYAAEPSGRVYFSGPNEAVAPGSEIIVNVLLDTPYPINAFDLEVKYPKDKLEFLNSDNSASIVDIWQPQPKVLKSGNIGLTGGLFKAFVGNGANIIKFSFKVLEINGSKDTILINFAKTDLYLADGKATKIPTVAGDFSLSIDIDGKVLSSSSVIFQNTETNKTIEEEVHRIEVKMLLRNGALVLVALVLLAFYFFRVYNKRKF